jgi:hypothetical protein
MDHKEIRGMDMDWVHVAQNRDLRQAVVNSVMKLHVSYKAQNLSTT